MARNANFGRLTCVALLAAFTACSDEPNPVSVELDVELPEDGLPLPAQVFEQNAVFSDRAHLFDGEAFELRSSPAEVDAGTYRFAAIDEVLPEVSRDDFIVTPGPDGQMALRLVVESIVEDGELHLETAAAYWHEVVRGGTYNISIPLDGSDVATFETPGPQQAPVNVSATGLVLPAAELELDGTDICQRILDITGQEVCGEEVEKEIGAGVTVRVAGTLDSLRIVTGNVRVTGVMDLAVTVESGGISGGRRPVFSPCNRAAYRGCLTTPTGANLIDFLRRWAPSIPDGSLAPNRVCIPLTLVRVRKGYWTGFRYTPPVYELCRVSDFGELPEVVPPSVKSIESVTTPRIDGEVTLRVKGDGEFGLKIQLPVVGWQAAYDVSSDMKVKASLGLFLNMNASIRNGGGTVQFRFDDTGLVTQTWTDTGGWDGDFEITDKSNHVELLRLDSPDSVVIRFGVPLEANVEACISLAGCEDDDDDDADDDDGFGDWVLGNLAVGAKLGATVAMFEEATWTREQVNPDDAEVDNWHISIDAAYDLNLTAGLTVPLTGWILPDVPREYDETFECCRVSMGDYWGQGALEVTATTTGVDLDPDGYTVLVEQADDPPEVLDEGATRLGPGWPTRVFAESVDPDDSTRFGLGFIPCIAIYSDAYLATSPVMGLSVAAARASGVGVPTFAVTSPCRWLIAPYTVTLAGVASNCTVTGEGAVRERVWLQQTRLNPPRSGTKQLSFEVVCSAADPQGSLEVTLEPGFRGEEAPPYVLLNGQTAGTFVESDVLLVTGLAPGAYDLEVLGINAFCTAAPVTVSVVAEAVAPISVTPVCDYPTPPTGSVTFNASTAGEMPDGNAYQVTKDGEVVVGLPLNGPGTTEGLAADVPTAFWVTDIAGNCQAEGLNPRVVTLDGAGTPVEIAFPVRCFEEKPDTLVGTIDASGWPLPSVTMRAADGTTLIVNGPKAAELARFTGTSLRVWGQVSATGISVNGYDLRSPLGDDRWLGILMDRPDGTWLFGEEAILLVNPPAALIAESGNLVWLMGREVDGGVQPTLYGVVRGGGS